MNSYFNTMNELIKGLHPLWHMITAVVMIAMYSHIAIGFLATKNRLKTYVKIYFKVSLALMLFYFFGKFSSPGYAILDIFLPVYIVYYFNSLLILQSRYLCKIKNVKDLGKNLMKFKTYHPKNKAK